MSVKVAFYKGNETRLDSLVQWWTRSPYSHCEIVLPTANGGTMAYSSSPRDGGVRGRAIAWNPDHWDFIGVPWANETRVLDWFAQHRGAKYDWLGLLGFVIPHTLNSPDRWFCSEACAAALELPKPWTLSPHDLYLLLTQKGSFGPQAVLAV